MHEIFVHLFYCPLEYDSIGSVFVDFNYFNLMCNVLPRISKGCCPQCSSQNSRPIFRPRHRLQSRRSIEITKQTPFTLLQSADRVTVSRSLISKAFGYRKPPARVSYDKTVTPDCFIYLPALLRVKGFRILRNATMGLCPLTPQPFEKG